MARRRATVDESTAVEEVVEADESGLEVEHTEFEDVDVPAEDDEVEEIATGEATEAEAKPKKEVAPKRGDLQEGDVTPVQLAKELSKPIDGNPENEDPSNWRYTKKTDGSHVVVPQMVYSYLKNPGDLKIRNGVVDSNGVARNNIVNLTEALAWWDAKAEKAVERAANAKTKAEKAAAKAAAAPAEGEAASETNGTVEEAE